MPIHPAVAIKVAEVGRNAFGIARIVAQHRNRHLALERLILQRLCGRIGDINRPFVVAAEMLTDLLRVNKHLRLLTRAIKVQQRATVGKWICHLQPGSIPARTLVIARLRIHRIATVETMRQRDWRPNDIVARLVTAPNLPRAAERTLIMLPAGGKALLRFSRCQWCRHSKGEN